MSTRTSSVSRDCVISLLRHALGDEAVLVDDASRQYYANDIFWQPGVLPEAIVLPSTPQQAADPIRIACGADRPVVPRGGGMSYLKGYLPATCGAIVVDATRLARVVEVNVHDRYITVEAGCTWADVNAALDGTGWRTAFWGTLSGRKSTIGGALAQNGAFYGSAAHGAAGENVIGLRVVLPDGRLVTTGSAGRPNTKPFTRDGGPDMTGLFVGDNGTLGFKVAATLRLAPRRQHVGCLSFGFSSLASMARAQIEMSPLEEISEVFGIDRAKVELSASFGDPESRRSQRGAAAGGAPDGHDLRAHPFTLHLNLEGRSEPALDAALQAVRDVARHYGEEIVNTVPIALRKHPFGSLRGILGRHGERWIPVHGIFPMSAVIEACHASEAFFDRQADFMREHGIRHTIMTMTVGSEFFLEPSFYWIDEITPLHAGTLGAGVVKPWIGRRANERTREAVVMLRRKAQELYAGLGAVSWQAARDYPFREIMNPEAYGLLCSLKRAVDPKGLMNPGILGFAQ